VNVGRNYNGPKVNQTLACSDSNAGGNINYMRETPPQALLLAGPGNGSQQ